MSIKLNKVSFVGSVRYHITVFDLLRCY